MNQRIKAAIRRTRTGDQGFSLIELVVAVIIVGIAWMFGYLDLRKAAFVVLGIGIIFGATEIVNMIAGG